MSRRIRNLQKFRKRNPKLYRVSISKDVPPGGFKIGVSKNGYFWNIYEPELLVDGEKGFLTPEQATSAVWKYWYAYRAEVETL